MRLINANSNAGCRISVTSRHPRARARFHRSLLNCGLLRLIQLCARGVRASAAAHVRSPGAAARAGGHCAGDVHGAAGVRYARGALGARRIGRTARHKTLRRTGRRLRSSFHPSAPNPPKPNMTRWSASGSTTWPDPEIRNGSRAILLAHQADQIASGKASKVDMIFRRENCRGLASLS